MKKVLMTVFVLGAVLFSAVSQETVQIGLYGTNLYATGEMADFAFCSVGGGAAIEYRLPFLPVLGMSARIEAEGVAVTGSDLNRWLTASGAAGVWYDISFGGLFSFRPELSYGVILDIIDSAESELDGKHWGQMLQFAASLRFAPAALAEKKLSLEIAPLYTVTLEQKNFIHYLGFRTGIYCGLN